VGGACGRPRYWLIGYPDDSVKESGHEDRWRLSLWEHPI
jgi:hypothetical protein